MGELLRLSMTQYVKHDPVGARDKLAIHENLSHFFAWKRVTCRQYCLDGQHHSRAHQSIMIGFKLSLPLLISCQSLAFFTSELLLSLLSVSGECLFLENLQLVILTVHKLSYMMRSCDLFIW